MGNITKGKVINVKNSQIINILESYAPKYMAEDFDNVGLLIGDASREAESVMLCLDVDEFVAEEAVKKGVGLIVSHHPIMFSPIKKITADTSEGRCILKLIENNIALYSAHTNLDAVKGGLNDLMCEILGIDDAAVLAKSEGDFGIGRVGMLSESVTLRELAEKIKVLFSLESVRFSGNEDRKIERVALCSGGGSSMVYDAVAAGADVYISGDLKYNNVRDLVFSGVGFIEIPHYKSEIFAPKLFEKILDGYVKTYISECNVDIFNNI